MAGSQTYVRAALVLGGAVGVFGASFGVLAVTAGLSVGQAVVMSLLVFTGASQFAAVGVVDAGGTVAAAVASALLLAARNTAYGVALAPIIRHRPAVQAVAAHLVLDETTALATAQADPRHAVRAFWITGISVFAFWNMGTAAGALAGRAVGDPAALGLDAAFPAGFVALLVPHLRRPRGLLVAGAAGALALALTPLTPVGVPILAAAGVALAAGLVVPEARR